MHQDEVAIDLLLVQHLIDTQFPQWAGQLIRQINHSGTDNAIFRLGDDLAVRLPRIHWAAEAPAKEYRWLPQLAPPLPLSIPVPIALGVPDESYPYHWYVYPWLEGENPVRGQLVQPERFATDLAGFMNALHSLDATGGPAAERGFHIAERDGQVREVLRQLEGRVDTRAALKAWEQVLDVPAWDRSPRWIHGDPMSGNLLVQQGHLSAIIDFGGLGVGDPAADLITAWNLFDAPTRRVYRNALELDEATWVRGRGWALSVALVALPYYWDTSPAIRERELHTLAEILTDEDQSSQG